MSAYIVENSTISDILSFLSRHPGLHFSLPSFIDQDKLYSEYYRQSVGQRLLDLNVASVNARYNGTDSDEYEAEPVTTISPVQAVKTIRCYLYQSCEGDCDKDETYLEMRKLVNAIAMAIVESMPAYEAANWG